MKPQGEEKNLYCLVTCPRCNREQVLRHWEENAFFEQQIRCCQCCARITFTLSIAKWMYCSPAFLCLDDQRTSPHAPASATPPRAGSKKAPIQRIGARPRRMEDLTPAAAHTPTSLGGGLETGTHGEFGPEIPPNPVSRRCRVQDVEVQQLRAMGLATRAL